MTAHSSCHKSFRMNRKGYSAIIGTIFMVLIILFLYFNVFTFSLNRNTDFQDVISRSEQLDADRNAEQLTISNVVVNQSQTNQIIVRCTLVNTGSVPIQMARLWVQDNSLSQNNVGTVGLLTPIIALEPGSITQVVFPAVTISGALSTHSFYFWLVTFRGNLFSKTV